MKIGLIFPRVLLEGGKGGEVVFLGIDLETAAIGDGPGPDFRLAGKVREGNFPQGLPVFGFVSIVQGYEFFNVLGGQLDKPNRLAADNKPRFFLPGQGPIGDLGTDRPLRVEQGLCRFLIIDVRGHEGERGGRSFSDKLMQRRFGI